MVTALLSASKETNKIADRYGTFPVDIAAFNRREEITLKLSNETDLMSTDDCVKLL